MNLSTEPSSTKRRRRAVNSAPVRLAVGVVLLEFVAAVQTFVASSLLPLIAHDLHAQDRLALLVTGTTIGTFVALPVAGRVVARLGLRRTLALALAGYAGGCTVAATAGDAWLFAAGRVVAGCSSGLLAVFGISAVIRFFDARMRARVIAACSAMWIVPALVGPPATLVLADAVGWRWALLAPFPLVVLGRLLVGQALRSDSADTETGGPRRSLGPVLLVPVGVTLLILGTSGTTGWPLAVIGIALAMVGVTRLLPAGTPRARRGIPAALVAMLLFGTGYFGAQSLVTVLLTTGYGAALSTAGLALTVGALGWALTSLLTPRLLGSEQQRSVVVAAAGLAAAAVGVAALAGLLVAGPGGNSTVIALVAWAVAGVGIGLAYPAVYLLCTTVPEATARPQAGADISRGDAAELAAAVILAEAFGTLLGGAVGAGVASLLVAAGASRSAGLAASYAVFALCLALAASVALRARPASA